LVDAYGTNSFGTGSLREPALIRFANRWTLNSVPIPDQIQI